MSAVKAAAASKTLPAYARTADRAVHVKIHPQPQNVAESREVLRVLQRYGEVIVYRHLKHEPNLRAVNTSLAIYQNSKSAQNAINASPVRFQIGRQVADDSKQKQEGSIQIPNEKRVEEQSPNNGEQLPEESSDAKKEWLESFATGQKIKRESRLGTTTSYTDSRMASQILNSQYPQANTIPTSPPHTPRPFTPNPTPSSSSSTSLPYPPSPNSTTSDSLKEGSKEFSLSITQSILNHQAYIKRQHYYGGFQLHMMNTMAEDLEARVPVKGMVDCQLGKGELPYKLRRKKIESGENGESARKPLRELWEEGRRAQ
ncbi:hypothetical protein ACLMJK_008459 [Lecanora helva]